MQVKQLGLHVAGQPAWPAFHKRVIHVERTTHVRSKTDVAQKNEVLCKVLCHNICCVIRSQVELGIAPVFWPDAPADIAAEPTAARVVVPSGTFVAGYGIG